MKKRALSLIATLCLLFALLPTAAFAEDVGKITPYIESVTANPITYGQTLADSSVQGNVYSDSTKQTAVEGRFVWENETIKPTAKDDSDTTLYTVIFKPTDTAKYNEANAQITITVNKAQNAPNMPDSTMSVLYSVKMVWMADLPEKWRWQDSDEEKALEVEVAQKATALYKGADQGNYEKESIEITITRTDCPEHVGGRNPL